MAARSAAFDRRKVRLFVLLGSATILTIAWAAIPRLPEADRADERRALSKALDFTTSARRSNAALEWRIRLAPLRASMAAAERANDLKRARELRRDESIAARGLEALAAADRAAERGRWRRARSLYHLYLASVPAHTLPTERKERARARFAIARTLFEAASSERADTSAAVSLPSWSPNEPSLQRIEVEAEAQAFRVVADHASAPALIHAIAAHLDAAFEDRRTETQEDTQLSLRLEARDPSQALREVAGMLGAALVTPTGVSNPWRLIDLPESAAEAGRTQLHLLALEASHEAAITQPDSEEQGSAHLLRGHSHEALGQPRRALAEYEALVRTRPRDAAVPAALMRLHELLLAEDRSELAAEALDRLITLHPDAPEAAHAMLDAGDLLLARGLDALALDRFERLLSNQPAPELVLAAKLGAIEARAGIELRDARPASLRGLLAELDALTTTQHIASLRPRYLRVSSRLLRYGGTTPLALRETLAAADAQPSAAPSRRWVFVHAAQLALKLERPWDAWLALESSGLATRLENGRAAPGEEALALDIARDLGLLQDMLKRFTGQTAAWRLAVARQDAEEGDLDRLLRLASAGSAAALEALCKSMQRAGRDEECARWLEQQLADAGGAAPTALLHQELAHVYERLERWEDATAVLRAEGEALQDAHSRGRMASALLHAGRPELAIESLAGSTDPSLQLWAARLCAASGDANEARQAFESLQRERPMHSEGERAARSAALEASLVRLREWEDRKKETR